MKVDKQLVDKLANLSKLNFTESEEQEIIKDLNKMVDFVDKLKEIPVDGVEPLIYMIDETNVMREDEVKMEITKEEALKNAPLADSDYFKVPKVLKKK
ncbi:MAG: Asp-tRNA(Asn)/Glu-tRNA(Gln) amidotransferase subunit GatC [Fimbriimonadaceae bacterium]|nr:Asp-tRNA(Asn)/Glu-tRNA(Gln) amidotransferase subunit GatC [Chitinophagales bacterium]